MIQIPHAQWEIISWADLTWEERQDAFAKWVEEMTLKIWHLISPEHKWGTGKTIQWGFAPSQIEGFENQDIYLRETNIENGVLKNIPNLMAYFFVQFGDDFPQIEELLLALWKYYQHFTKKHLFWIDWSACTSFPTWEIATQLKEKKLPKNFENYLRGYSAHVSFVAEENKKRKYTPKQLLYRSHRYREKIQKILDLLEYSPEVESLKKIVMQTFSTLPNIQTISEKQMVETLKKEAQKRLQDIAEGVRSEAKKANLESFLEYLNWLLQDPSVSDVSKQVRVEVDTAHLKSQYEHLLKIRDGRSLIMFEDEICSKIMRVVTRFTKEKSENEHQDALPKNFMENQTLTCFSWVWLIASLLIESGIKQENIYFVQTDGGSIGSNYVHSYLIVKKSDGTLIKIDYWFDSFAKTNSPRTIDSINQVFDSLALWFPSVSFRGQDSEFINSEWRFYNLTSGISLVYLLWLWGHLLEEWKYEQCLFTMHIALSIDENNYLVYDLLWLASDALENDDTMQYFIESHRLNKQGPLALFHCWEYFFHEKNYDTAEFLLKRFLLVAKRARKVDDHMKFQAVMYLRQLKELQAKKEQEWTLQTDEGLSQAKIDMIIQELINSSDSTSGMNLYFTYEAPQRQIILSEIQKKLWNNFYNDAQGIIILVVFLKIYQEEQKRGNHVDITLKIQEKKV